MRASVLSKGRFLACRVILSLALLATFAALFAPLRAGLASGVGMALSQEQPAGPDDAARPAVSSGTDVTNTGWVLECVDCPKFFTEMTDRSLRLDAAGRPHIAYGGDHLYHAWHDGTAWRYETVDIAPGVGRYASLALDGTGQPHISYYDRDNDDLKYARWDGVAWQIETVDSAGRVGLFTSLALDKPGRPHISYASNYDLKYARRLGGIYLPMVMKNYPPPTATPTPTMTPAPTATPTPTIAWHACVLLTASKSVYHLGEPVLILLMNGCLDTIWLPCTAPWVIKDNQGNVVFVPLCYWVLTPVQPGETKHWLWDQRDQARNQVPPGAYTVELYADANVYTAGFDISQTPPPTTITPLRLYLPILFKSYNDVTSSGEP